jgi:hypothetical protein
LSWSPGSYWHNPEAHDALQDNKLNYLFHSLLGFRGLFLLSPLMLLWIWALGHSLRGRNNIAPFFRQGLWILSAGAVVIIGFAVLRTHNYGGWCIGMRWYIQFSLVMLLLSLLCVLPTLLQQKWQRMVVVLLLTLSLPATFQALREDAFSISWHELLLRPGIVDTHLQETSAEPPTP